MFIGREHELATIKRHLKDRSKAQLLVIYGRRRIGKSRLIREALRSEKKALFFEGVEGEDSRAQVAQFTLDLAQQTGRVRLAARSWREAFQGLGELIAEGRWVIVFDEFPWMGAGRTRIVSELKLHWDRWSSTNEELALILCGSVASFMTRHVVHSKALHNRKTMEMCLGPLSPRESGCFIAQRGLREKAQLHMCLGGVPKYLEQIDPRESLEKNLNRLVFTANGFFIEEFETLFKEQFRSPRVYEEVIRALAQAPGGPADLARRVGSVRGGGFQEQLENLQRAQFIRSYYALSPHKGRRRRTLRYKLIDPFLSFYFRYIHDHRDTIRHNRRENLFRSIAGPTINAYFGYAWEHLVEDALGDLLPKMGISLGDVLQMGPYFQQTSAHGEGLQIDWLVLRRDHVWTVIECKYTSRPLGMEILSEVERKIERLGVPPEVSVERVLISASGVTPAVAKRGVFAHVLTLKDIVG
ncbi:MAG: ATP-binding protein [Deltaproteobacteria bacterium]|nr:ATP-binding protein [Deltaproteobacteria bacterium]